MEKSSIIIDVMCSESFFLWSL